MQNDVKKIELQSPNDDIDETGREILEFDQLNTEVELVLTVSVGNAVMDLGQTNELKIGSVITLDKFSHEPVDLVLNNEIIGKGELVVVGDYFGIKLIELNKN